MGSGEEKILEIFPFFEIKEGKRAGESMDKRTISAEK
jgi:hypothetical protein